MIFILRSYQMMIGHVIVELKTNVSGDLYLHFCYHGQWFKEVSMNSFSAKASNHTKVYFL
jgi:hypothetical protein